MPLFSSKFEALLETRPLRAPDRGAAWAPISQVQNTMAFLLSVSRAELGCSGLEKASWLEMSERRLAEVLWLDFVGFGRSLQGNRFGKGKMTREWKKQWVDMCRSVISSSLRTFFGFFDVYNSCVFLAQASVGSVPRLPAAGGILSSYAVLWEYLPCDKGGTPGKPQAWNTFLNPLCWIHQPSTKHQPTTNHVRFETTNQVLISSQPSNKHLPLTSWC